MKRLAWITGILALAAPLALAQSSVWQSDPAHSEVDFTITHGGVSKVHGRFGKVAATIHYNEADPSKSTVTATIGVDTVDTGESARDSHLKTDAFFDVARFSTATFTSSSVVKNGSRLTVSGILTLHGISKPVVLEVDGPVSPVENMMDHKLHSGFSASTTITRTAFDIGSKFPAMLIGDEVKLTIDLEVIKQ